MRIQYVKKGGDGRVVDIEPGAGRRLVASGQAVEVGADDKPVAGSGAKAAPKRTGAKQPAGQAGTGA